MGVKLKNSKKREFGEALLSEKSRSILFKDFFSNKKLVCGWVIMMRYKIPKGFRNIALQIIRNILQFKIKKIYTDIQFHPEVTHTQKGQKIKNFVLNICKAKKLDDRNWKK